MEFWILHQIFPWMIQSRFPFFWNIWEWRFKWMNLFPQVIIGQYYWQQRQSWRVHWILYYLINPLLLMFTCKGLLVWFIYSKFDLRSFYSLSMFQFYQSKCCWLLPWSHRLTFFWPNSDLLTFFWQRRQAKWWQKEEGLQEWQQL